MFVTVDTIGKENVSAGDPVVIKYDSEFGRIGAFGIDGKIYGYLRDVQPLWCVDGWTMYSRIGDRRVIARAAVVENGAMLLGFDTPAFRVGRYARAESANNFCKYSQMLL